MFDRMCGLHRARFWSPQCSQLGAGACSSFDALSGTINPAGGLIRKACSLILGYHLMKRPAWFPQWLRGPAFFKKKATRFDSSHAFRSAAFRVIRKSPETMIQSPSLANSEIHFSSGV
jgi:hypothetical protein